jgi:glycosyltransferase involved in cell wall biosynthesis
MHILFLTDNFIPESNAPAIRTHYNAAHWVKRGHKVTIITCVPNFPSGVVFEGYENRIHQTEVIDGIRVCRVWSFISPNKGVFLRILDFLSFMVSAIIAGLFVKKVDIVVGTSPQLFTICAAQFLARLKGCPFVFEMRDIWPESFSAVDISYARLLTAFGRPLAFQMYKSADHMIVLSHSFKTYLIQLGLKPHKISVIPNGINRDVFFPRDPDADLELKLDLKGKFVVGYIGTHGRAHALDVIAKAAKLAQKHPDLKTIKFVTVGTGEQFDELALAFRGLDNVLMIGQVSASEIHRYWSILDVGIVHLRRSKIFEMVIPSKMFEGIGMGVPLLFGVRGESARIVKENASGICFLPESPKSLINALREMKKKKGFRRRIRIQSPLVATKFDRKKLANDMEKQLLKVVYKNAK